MILPSGEEAAREASGVAVRGHKRASARLTKHQGKSAPKNPKKGKGRMQHHVHPALLGIEEEVLLGDPPLNLCTALIGHLFLLWQPGWHEQRRGRTLLVAPWLCVAGLSTGLPFSKGVEVSNRPLQTALHWALRLSILLESFTC